MGHTVPDSLIYVFLNLVSHDADAFSSAVPNIYIFIILIFCFLADRDHFDKSVYICCSRYPHFPPIFGTVTNKRISNFAAL